ncbi:MAG: hypothetical protein WBQ59_28885 [Candidatus Acidiferrum sp.]
MFRQTLVLLSAVLWATSSEDLLAQSAKINFVADRKATDIPLVFHPETFAVWSGGALLEVEDHFYNNPLVHVVDYRAKKFLDSF